MLGCGEQTQRQQIDRIDIGGLIDRVLDVHRQLIDDRIDPGGLFVELGFESTPVGIVTIQQLLQENRLSEIDCDFAVVVPQFAERPEQAQQRLLFLGGTGEFGQIALALHHLFVADINRLKNDGCARLTQEGAQGHRQHAGLRFEQSAGA